MTSKFLYFLQQIKTSNRTLNYSVAGIFIVKILLAGFFSSGYLNQIFLPFVHFFVANHFSDPWQHFFSNHSNIAFPYPPLMLYILTPSASILYAFNLHNIFWIQLIIKAPIYIADWFIFYLLCLWRPQAKALFIVVYLLSPITFFAAYLQGQLDLISVAFLLMAIFLLFRKNIITAGSLFAAALLCKSTAIVTLPFILIFIYRKHRWHALGYFLLAFSSIYCVVSFPYLLHTSYIQTVLNNAQQDFIFNSAYPIGNLKLYPVILLLVAINAHFFLYKKINHDLLLSYLELAFSIFLIFAYPVASWFIWITPYLALFLTTSCKEQKEFLWLYAGFCFVYIIFFLFFYQYPLDPSIPNLIVQGKALAFNFNIPSRSSNTLFTILAAILFFQTYLNYRYSIRNNAIYKGSNHPVLIGISGDSGAGKSVFLKDIYDLLGKTKVTYLEGDGEHRWERGNDNWKKYTHLDPKANFLHQQADALTRLKQGLDTHRRDYDHHTGKFTEVKTIKPNDYIVIAGLHPFYLPKARKIIDIKIYLDTDETLRLHWKTQRDSETRGRSSEQVLHSLQQREPDREKYIVPQKKFADLCYRYFLDQNNEIKLQVSLSANIDLEKIYFLLEASPLLFFSYDYSEDLQAQYIIFSGSITAHRIAAIAQEVISNLDELLDEDIQWQADFRGIRQLIMLVVIHHYFRELE